MRAGDTVYRVYRQVDGSPVVQKSVVTALGSGRIKLAASALAWEFRRIVPAHECAASEADAVADYVARCQAAVDAAQRLLREAIAMRDARRP